MSEDIGSKLTDLLDEQPEQPAQEQEPDTLEIDENALIIDYYRVRGGEIVDPATIRRLATKFAALSQDFDFDAGHAQAQLNAYAEKLEQQ